MSLREFTDGKLNRYLLETHDFGKVFRSADHIEIVLGELTQLRKVVNSAEINSSGSIPEWLTDKFFELGLYSITLPRKWKGLDASMLDFVKLVIALSSVDASIAMSVVPHTGMGLGSILKFGNEFQKKEILSDLVEKKKRIAFAMTESHAGSDLPAMYSILEKGERSGEYLLSGAKSWITNGEVAETIVVCARCPELIDVPDASLFVHINGDEPGLVKQPLVDKMGHRGAITTDLYFDKIRISSDHIIGFPGKGFEQFNALVDSGRFGVAAAAVAMAEKAIKTAFEDHLFAAKIPDPLVSSVVSLKFQMEAALFFGAIAYDLNLKEKSSITALVKIFCTNQAWNLINSLMDFLPCDGMESIVVYNQLFNDVPIYRITEGPNEVIGHRCALDIVTSFSNPEISCDSILPFISAEFREFGVLLDESLSIFSDFVKKVRIDHRPLSENQLALDRVFRFSTEMFVFLSTLLYADACSKVEEQAENYRIGREALRLLSEKLKRVIGTLLQEEEMNQDSTLSELSDILEKSFCNTASF